jgi:aminoglycoside 3-N-acetyltransferase I
MTTSERAEVFIFDIAVRPDQQRRGVGRRLVSELCARAKAEGIATVFVAADDEDAHALDFYRALGAAGAAVTMFEFGP